jgi:hypothetical protein
MGHPEHRPIHTRKRRAVAPHRVFTWGVAVLGLLFLTIVGVAITRSALGFVGGFGHPAEPTITQTLVLERLQDVAKLASTEMVLRDVVVYEQTRFHSTKRSLLVVTGRVSAGIDLRRASAEIDARAKRIDVTLPPAEILSIEVLSVTTYDESSGLLNPFTPEDRDLIQFRIRTQLREAAKQSQILEHADGSATKALEGFFGGSGYTVRVKRTLDVVKPSG